MIKLLVQLGGYFVCALMLVSGSSAVVSEGSPKSYDVVVVGATFSGIAAAINAAHYDHSVLIVEEYPMIGGLMTGGLSFTDFLSHEALGGIFRDYTDRVEQYYIQQYGDGSQQHQDCHRGIHAEPYVTLKILEEMLAEYPSIEMLTNHRLETVQVDSAAPAGKTVQGITITDKASKAQTTVPGEMFVDATYEGDLAAYAGAEYRIGRESRQEYGEPLAGKLFFDEGRIAIGSTGRGDHRVQAYNYRIIMTNDSANRIAVPKPMNYDRERYLPIAEVLKQGNVADVFVEKRYDGIFLLSRLPNNKFDVNDIKNAPVRMAMLGESYGYPDGNWDTRDSIIAAHKSHNLGMIYFIQNDASVPEQYQQAARKWGLAKDEFPDTDHFPPRLYIREARRVMGEYVFTQNDVNTIENTFIVEPKEDAIAIGDYALNCHGVAPASLYPSVAEGDFNLIPPPFQIPMGVIMTKGFANLLVSVAVSSSHVGFSGLRLEPTWTALGQAAGLVAHLALQEGTSTKEVDVRNVQELLHDYRAKTIYVSDIEADSPYFQATQYLGMRGFIHDLFVLGKDTMPGTKKYNSIRGTQYTYAYPFHELQPDQTVDSVLVEQWSQRLLAIAPDRKEALDQFLANGLPTRGVMVNKLYDWLTQ